MRNAQAVPAAMATPYGTDLGRVSPPALAARIQDNARTPPAMATSSSTASENGHPAAAPETRPAIAINFTSPAPIQPRHIASARGAAQTKAPNADSRSSVSPPSQRRQIAITSRAG